MAFSPAVFHVFKPAFLVMSVLLICPAAALELDMDGAVDLAVLRSRELRGRLSALEMAEARFSLAFLKLLPSVTVGVSGSGRVMISGPDSRSLSCSLGAEQVLWDGGELQRTREALRQTMAIGQAEYLALTTGTIISAVSSYARVLGLLEQIHLQTCSLESARDQQLLAEEEFSQGELTKLELTLLRISLEEQETALRKTAQELEKVRFSLRTLLRLPEDPVLTGSLNTGYSGFLEPAPPEEYASRMESSSPEYQGLRIKIRELERRLERPLLHYSPLVSASVSLDLRGEDPRNLQPSFSGSLRVDFSTALPLGLSVQAEQTPPLQRGITGSTSVSLEPNEEMFLNRRELTRQLEDLTEEYRVKAGGDLLDIKHRLEDLENFRAGLRLDREKNLVLKQRLRLAERQLEQGEITRSALMELQAEQARHELSILQAILDLFTAELDLLQKAGMRPEGRKLREIMQ